MLADNPAIAAPETSGNLLKVKVRHGQDIQLFSLSAPSFQKLKSLVKESFALPDSATIKYARSAN